MRVSIGVPSFAASQREFTFLILTSCIASSTIGLSAMSPMNNGDPMEGLALAKKVLSQIMRLKTSKLLFNEPVDAVALGLDDYTDKVKQPMDFGTIMSRLLQGANPYKKPSEVLRDVNLVFHNCFTYNDSEADTVTRELCSEVQTTFNKKWTEAGLSLDCTEEFSQEIAPKAAKNGAIAWSSETAVPPELSYEEGETIGLIPCGTDLCGFIKCSFLLSVLKRLHQGQLLFICSKFLCFFITRCKSHEQAFNCLPVPAHRVR
jgi:hypothetical protein